jgi:hypothetical protein
LFGGNNNPAGQSLLLQKVAPSTDIPKISKKSYQKSSPIALLVGKMHLWYFLGGDHFSFYHFLYCRCRGFDERCRSLEKYAAISF